MYSFSSFIPARLAVFVAKPIFFFLLMGGLGCDGEVVGDDGGASKDAGSVDIDAGEILDAAFLDAGDASTDAGEKDGGVVEENDAGMDGGLLWDGGFDAGMDGGAFDGGLLDAGNDAGVDAGPPDLACSLDEMCPQGWSCIAGGCQAPFSIDAGTEAVAPLLDVTRYSLGLPTGNEDDLAGFDLDGDNVVDNQYGLSLAILGPALGLTDAALNAIFRSPFAEPVFGFQLQRLAARSEVSVWQLHPTTPYDVVPRASGLGHVLLSSSSAGPNGALWQANAATGVNDVDAGTWQVDGVFAKFPIVLPGFLGGNATAAVTLDDVHFSILVEENREGCSGFCTVDEGAESPQSDAEKLGIRIGGSLPVDEFALLLNASFTDCQCPAENGPLFVVTRESITPTDPPKVSLRCTYAVDDCTGGGTCDNLPSTCSAIGLIGNILDLDTDLDGENDAMSIGMQFSAVGTTADGFFTPISPLPNDAGVQPDAGNVLDAGALVDAGALANQDAGQSLDAGVDSGNGDAG